MATEMRMDLSGALGNASRCIKWLMEALKESVGEEEFDEICCNYQPDSEIFTLAEIIRHIKETRAGEHSIERFAEFYCLKKE